MAQKSGFGVCFGSGTLGPEAKPRLECRIKKFFTTLYLQDDYLKITVCDADDDDMEDQSFQWKVTPGMASHAPLLLASYPCFAETAIHTRGNIREFSVVRLQFCGRSNGRSL